MYLIVSLVVSMLN